MDSNTNPVINYSLLCFVPCTMNTRPTKFASGHCLRTPRINLEKFVYQIGIVNSMRELLIQRGAHSAVAQTVKKFENLIHPYPSYIVFKSYCLVNTRADKGNNLPFLVFHNSYNVPVKSKIYYFYVGL